MNTYLIWGNKNTTLFCFEAVVSECDNILGLINNRSESPRNPAPDFEEFKLSMNERLTNQETLFIKDCSRIGIR